MSNINIVGIAPYNGLMVSMKNAAKEYKNITFDCYQGDLMDGVDIVKNLNSDKIDVIISRGGTALLLKKLINIPVVEINVSIYDVLRTLRLAQNFDGKLAVVGFQNITDRANVLNELLNLNLEIVSIDDELSAESVLTNLKEKNYDIIISDQITSSIARQIGLNAILITSVEETIKESIEQAITIGKTRLEMRKNNTLLKSINELNPVQVIVFNSYDQEVDALSSSSIPKSIKSKIKQIVQTKFNSTRNTIREHYKGKIYTIIQKNLDLEKETFKAFYIYISEVAPSRNKAINLTKELPINNKPDSFFNSSLSIGNNKKQINDFSKTNEPVLLAGEKGTGKDKIAHIIYENSNHNRHLWEIDCALLTKTEWDNLFNSIESPFYDENTTIYLQNINKLNLADIHILIEYIKNNRLHKRNKIIASFTENLSSSDSETFNPQSEWPFVYFRINSLRERKTDMPAIGSLYINEYNNEYGKQIIGFETQALERIINYDWPQNQNQFRRVIKQLVINTSGSYIKDKDVIKQLKSELKDVGSFSSNVIQLDQTLEEINNDIIQLILKEENGNKTKSAERLGISRSTLWRILSTND